MDEPSERAKVIRRLRKKLRQIEYLEHLSRPLNEFESVKVGKKDDIRQELLQQLNQESEEEEDDDEIEIFRKGGEQESILVDLSTQPTVEEVNQSRDEDRGSEESENETTSKAFAGKVQFALETEVAQPMQTQQTKGKEKNKKKPLTPTSLVKDWNSEVFKVRTLIGHTDIIYSVSVDNDIIVTASRDTSVKVWNAETGEEVAGLRGHTMAVTCVDLLKESDGEELGRYLTLIGNHRIALSGGADCNLKFWSVTEGREIKTIYTYNALTAIAYLQSEASVLTGAQGGNFELWNAVTSENLQSIHTDDDYIPNIRVFGENVFTSAPDGVISVWECFDRDLKLLYSSEDLIYCRSVERQSSPRQIRSMHVEGGDIYYGDDGANVKVLNWKNAKVTKLLNNISPYGATDAICSTGHEIVASSYNLDTGYGTLNVRKLGPIHKYLTSLGDGECGRILSIGCTKTAYERLRIVTAGQQLKVWDSYDRQLPRSKGKQVAYVKTIYVREYDCPTQDSEMESSASESTADSDSDADLGPGEHTYFFKDPNGPNEPPQSLFWKYCTIL